MSSDGMLLKILEKISEVSERTSRIEARCEIMEEDIKHIKAEDAEQNRLLAEHIRGVKQNAERLNLEQEARRAQDAKMEAKLKVQNSRLENLEEPQKARKYLAKVATWVTTVATAIAALTKLFGMW